MSDIHVEAVQISALTPHPNADRLEIAQVLGAECCVPKGKFQVGDVVAWFPPNILIPTPVADMLGVTNYLKPAVYPGDQVQTKCRVAACRLRGFPSFGFIASLSGSISNFAELFLKPGDNLDGIYRAHKYEPPTSGPGAPRRKGFNGDAAPDHPAFHKYTDIQNYYKYAAALEDGTPVRITEKLHGSNVRLGLINVDGEFQFMAGSHKVNWKSTDSKGNIPVWWEMMTEEVVNLLTFLCDEQHSVIVFGEVYGPGVQDLDYGAEDKSLRVFDISVDGRYLDYTDMVLSCNTHGVEMVPTLYVGPFSKEVLKEHTYGPTKMAGPSQIRSKFKDREGCVVTPLEETYSRFLGGRLILKSVSADYLDRKNPQDN